jgi:hypothetical protein
MMVDGNRGPLRHERWRSMRLGSALLARTRRQVVGSRRPARRVRRRKDLQDDGAT